MSILRLESTALNGMGEFRGQVEVNWQALPGTLIAILGKNGSGKTSLVEMSLPGALYRKTPTRGKLAKLARGRDSMLETRIHNGRQYVIRHTVDKVSDGGEAFVSIDGEPVSAVKNRRTYDVWLKKQCELGHLPPEDLLYAATFTVQGSTGFLGLDEGPRRSVLLRMIGIEHYEGLAKGARAKAEKAKHALALAVTRLADEQARGLDPDTAENALRLAEGEALAADQDEAAAKAALDTLATRRAEVEAALAHYERVQKELTEHSIRLVAVQVAKDGLLARQAGMVDCLLRAASIRGNALRYKELTEELATARGVWSVRESIEKRRSAAYDTLADAQMRLKNNKKLLADAASIQAAVDEDARLQSEAATIEGTVAKLDRDRLALKKDIAAAQQRQSESRRRIQDALARKNRTFARTIGKADVEAAIRSLPGNELELATAHTEEIEANRHLASLEEFQRTLTGRRIGQLRFGLSNVIELSVQKPAHFEIREIAEKSLYDDDMLVLSAETLPEQLEEAKARVYSARGAVQLAKDKLFEARHIAEGLKAIEAAEAEAKEAAAEIDRLAAAIQEDETKISAWVQAEMKLAREADELSVRLARILEARSVLANPNTGKLHLKPRLAEANAKIEAWTKVIERATADIKACEDELSRAGDARVLADVEKDLLAISTAPVELSRLEQTETQAQEVAAQLVKVESDLSAINAVVLPTLPSIPHAGLDLDPAKAQAAHEAAQQAAKTAHGMVQVAKARLEQAKESRAKLEKLDQDRLAAERDLADWKLLADALGAEGIQALLIDAIGPTLTEYVNLLLHKCHGPRFTVSIITQRPDADGKRMLECCQVMILDTKKGREDEGATFSGGEKVILNEAISLAMSMVACQRAGLKGVTMVRDESGAALDPDNGKAYISMLRLAATLVDASKVIIISHDPRISSMVDSTVRIVDGHVEVLS